MLPHGAQARWIQLGSMSYGLGQVTAPPAAGTVVQVPAALSVKDNPASRRPPIAPAIGSRGVCPLEVLSLASPCTSGAAKSVDPSSGALHATTPSSAAADPTNHLDSLIFRIAGARAFQGPCR